MTFYYNKHSIVFQYNIDTNIIPTSDSTVDVGILLNYNLNFTSHISMVCSKAMCSSIIISRSLYSSDASLRYRAFSIYVRSILENCSSVWCPYSVGNIRKIEKIQKMFTKRLVGFNNLSYMERLKKLKCDTLEIRRLKADLVMYYNVVHYSFNSEQFFTLKDHKLTRGHSLTIVKKKFNNNISRYAFNNRRIDIWNKLPQQIVNASNITIF